jgi:hypothetical protein
MVFVLQRSLRVEAGLCDSDSLFTFHYSLTVFAFGNQKQKLDARSIGEVQSGRG